MEIENYKIKKRKGGKVFFFLLTIICVGLCVVVSQFFASVISTGASQATAGGTSAEYTLYAISLGAYSSKAQAEDDAITARKQNAGGYVLKKDATYYVVASIYEKKNDADSVLKNLATSFDPEIIEIKVDKVDLAKISSSSLKKSYLAIVGDLKQVYLDLYDISVSLDTAVYSETKARIEADKVKTDLSSKLDKLSNGTASSDGVYYVIIKNKVQDILEEITSTVEFDSTDSYPLGAKIKNAYISVVDDIVDLVELLNEE